MARAAANYRDGGTTGFERLTAYGTPGLAYIVEIEHHETKVGGRDDISRVALRVTTILRRRTRAGRSCTVTRTRSRPVSRQNPSFRARRVAPAVVARMTRRACRPIGAAIGREHVARFERAFSLRKDIGFVSPPPSAVRALC